MDRSRRAIDRQRSRVATLTRELHFELLVLQRLLADASARDHAVADLPTVVDRATLRQAKAIVDAAEQQDRADPS